MCTTLASEVPCGFRPNFRGFGPDAGLPLPKLGSIVPCGRRPLGLGRKLCVGSLVHGELHARALAPSRAKPARAASGQASLLLPGLPTRPGWAALRLMRGRSGAARPRRLPVRRSSMLKARRLRAAMAAFKFPAWC